MNRIMKIGIVLFGLGLSSVLVMCTQQGDQANQGASDTQPAGSMTQEQLVARGKYLTVVAGCNDCHTPKVMTAQGPVFDTTRELIGHPADAPAIEYPANVISPTGWLATTNAHLTAWAGPWGISYSANLTPDQTTGIGAWTEEAFIETMRTGKHLGMGREILPPMPWQQIGQMTDEDLRGIFAYLMSLPPVMNQVPQPTPPPGAPMGDASQH